MQTSRSRRLSAVPAVAVLVALGLSLVIGLSVGPVGTPPFQAIARVLDTLPGISVSTGLSRTQEVIISEIRLPRVVLGMLVGATLALAGSAYQGVFRNPLADPYLLGSAAGAGLGATLAIGWGLGGGTEALSGLVSPVPILAFFGALGAVAVTYLVGGGGDRRRSTTSLLLAGVAVASLAAAAQTFFQQRYNEDIREVYSWILGRLSTAGWTEVILLLPYLTITAVVIFLNRRALDVMAVGDDEAASVGLNVARTRLIIVGAATLGTAAAVAVSGLIGFVGLVVPHAVRLAGVTSYRQLVPLSMVVGGAFLVLADVAARQVLAPAELPIGVVTAFVGAPFFVALLRNRRVVATP